MSNYIDMIAYSSGLGFVEAEDFLRDVPEHVRVRLAPREQSADDEVSEDFSMPDELSMPVWDTVAEDAPSDEPQPALTPSELEEILISRFEYEYPYLYATKVPRKLSVSRLKPDLLDGSEADAVLLEPENTDTADGERITKMGRLPVFASGSDETESARRGIATHLLFQFADFERLQRLGAKAELERLAAEKYISAEDAKRVRLSEVEAFRRSALFADMRRASSIWRELRFNTRLPAAMLTEDASEKARLGETDFLVQGVIDCLYEDGQGGLHLVDYKTDRLTREERESPALAEERLRRAHSLQLSYYAEAVKRMFGRAPVSVEVYSLHLGRSVEMKK